MNVQKMLDALLSGGDDEETIDVETLPTKLKLEVYKQKWLVIISEVHGFYHAVEAYPESEDAHIALAQLLVDLADGKHSPDGEVCNALAQTIKLLAAAFEERGYWEEGGERKLLV